MHQFFWHGNPSKAFRGIAIPTRICQLRPWPCSCHCPDSLFLWGGRERLRGARPFPHISGMSHNWRPVAVAKEGAREQREAEALGGKTGSRGLGAGDRAPE